MKKHKFGKFLFVVIVCVFIAMIFALGFEGVVGAEARAAKFERLYAQVDSLQIEIQNVRSTIDTLGSLSLNLKMENILLKNNILAYQDTLKNYRDANNYFFSVVLQEYQAKLDSFIVEIKK
jgi:uncharacterized protein YdcH (DUF465 family)